MNEQIDYKARTTFGLDRRTNPRFHPVLPLDGSTGRHDVNQSQTLQMRIGSQDRQVPGFVSLIPSLRRIFPNSLSPTIIVRRPYSKFLALDICLSSFI